MLFFSKCSVWAGFSILVLLFLHGRNRKSSILDAIPNSNLVVGVLVPLNDSNLFLICSLKGLVYTLAFHRYSSRWQQIFYESFLLEKHLLFQAGVH